MLSHSEFSGLRHDITSFFSRLPVELVSSINPLYFYNPDPNSDIAKALHLVAFGQLKELKTILEQAKAKPDKIQLKNLLLQTSDTVTRSGLQLKNKTLLECALGAGDMELAAMIMTYFNEFAWGPEEKKRQFEPYQSCIAAITTQQPDYDVTWLIEIIKKSPHQDVLAELARDDEYDPTYQSQLREAMNRFRSEMLDPKRRVITTARMHCNYKNLDYAEAILDREWNDLKIKEGDGYHKHRLVARQILGFIELVELPAYERYVFARGQSDKAIAGEKIERSLDYKYPSELGPSLPDYSEVNINSHTGVGFNSYVSIHGGCRHVARVLAVTREAALWWAAGGAAFQNLCRAKAASGRKFMLQLQQHPDHHPANEKRSSCVIL